MRFNNNVCIFFILLLIMINTSIAQQIRSFPDDHEGFYKELNQYLGDYKNETLKASYKIFKNNWDENIYSNEMKDNFIIAFNQLLKKKMQPYPYMHFYMNTVNVFFESRHERDKLIDWQEIVIQILKKAKSAYCFPKIMTKYRIGGESLQSNKFRNLFWIWNINKQYNKFRFFKNLISLCSISINSIIKYGILK